MPNYNLVVDSKFKPFSFSEYMAPYVIYGQAYHTMENQYSDYINKVQAVQSLADKEQDKEIYEQLSAYSQAFKGAASSLITNGLNPQINAQLMNLKGKYSNIVVPVQLAYDKREKERERQRKVSDATGEEQYLPEMLILWLLDIISQELSWMSMGNRTQILCIEKVLQEVSLLVVNIQILMREEPLIICIQKQ